MRFLHGIPLFIFSLSFFLVRASKKKETLKCNIESSFREGKKNEKKKGPLVCASVRFFFLLNFEEAFNAAAAAVGGGGVPYRTQNSVSIEVARAVHLLFSLIIVLLFFLFYFILFYSTSNKFIYSRCLSQCTARLKTTALFCLFICCAR